MSSTENNYVNTDLGNVALNSCGEYNADSSYEYLDTVNYEGGSYFCKVEFPKKISGIAPKAGVSTEFWQLLTIPGDATSEYIELHDEVVNKAKQVETSRAAVELSQTEVEAAQADVSQMRQDTQEAAEEAASSRDSAAGYAQSAETSRTAAKESEDNINAQVTEFDTHVAEKTSAAETAITEARRAAVNAVSTKQDDATQAVTDEGDKQIKNVEDAGTEQIGKAKSAGASAVSAAGAAGVSAVNAVKTQQTASIKVVADKGTQQVTAVNTAGSTQVSTIETKGADQVKAIKEAGENALQNISNSVDKGLSEEGKAADAKATGEAISNLTEDLGNLSSSKISKFYATNNGENHLADSDDGKIADMMVYGKSEQKSTMGKNLLKLSEANVHGATNGLLITMNADGSVSVTGTSTSSWSNIIKIDNKCHTDNATYTFSVDKNSDIVVGLKLGRTKLDDANYQTHRIMQNQLSCTFETGASNEYCSLFLEELTVGKSYNFTIYPMLELGTEATAYEPYTGGQPSPSQDYPQEIKSVVNPTIKLSNGDGTESQTVTLPYVLNAIPVNSGGNVTINGQQYVADYVDVERGKIVKCVEKYRIPSSLNWIYEPSENDRFGAYKLNNNINLNFGRNTLFTHYRNDPNGVGGFITLETIRLHNFQGFTDVTNFKEWLDKNESYAYFVKNTFEETDLTTEEIIAFKALATYYPTTNISVNSEQLEGYTVFNYPISMANGWNYVKQQLNDNRDYIYDMDTKTQDIDTQAAEAYVNSEYAVALTELEV